MHTGSLRNIFLKKILVKTGMTEYNKQDVQNFPLWVGGENAAERLFFGSYLRQIRGMILVQPTLLREATPTSKKGSQFPQFLRYPLQYLNSVPNLVPVPYQRSAYPPPSHLPNPTTGLSTLPPINGPTRR